MFSLCLTVAATSAALPELRPVGKGLVTADGKVVTLRGVNLGNWLLLEPWMFGLDQSDAPGGFPDQATILSVLTDRFGPERTHELMEVYRANWITPRDMAVIRSFGFNTVRLPFHYSLLEDDAQPMTLREDAFKWLDHAVAMADDAGLYMILDLHGVPGGQSIDAPTGQVDQNRLWTDRLAQERTIWLWSQLAERYRDHPTVVAYDVVNEPFGDFKTDISPIMADLFGRLHDAIRAVDAHTLIYAPGTLQGIAFYGDPSDRGWSNVGFTEHAYPGLFGWGETSLHGHARFLKQSVAGKTREIDAMGVPYLVGEFNVVFDHVGGPDLMREYFDTYNGQGWGATMWSYKIVKPTPGIEDSNWYMVSNDVSFDMNDLRTVDEAVLRERFESLGTMPLAVDEALREALTETEPGRVPLPELDVVFEAPDQTVPGWVIRDIGGATPGGLAVMDDGRWSVWGGGTDIFAARDDFRFIHAPASADAALWTRLDEMDATDRYAKAGLMLREDASPDAPHALLHALPDGRVVFAQRRERGGLTEEQTLAISGFPVGLGLERDGDEIVLHYTDAEGQWRSTHRPGPAFEEGSVGLAVLAHDQSVLCRAVFAAPSFDDRPLVQRLSTDIATDNLAQNPSFETVEHAQTAPDRAKHWNRWGHWINRQEGWTPIRSDETILAYHHWRIESADNSGVWQDVTGLTPGQTYELEVFGNLDPGQAGGRAPASVELRLETPRPDGTVLTLATRGYPAEDLATGEAWSRLTLSAEATDPTMRVLLIVYPSDDGPRDGALKFDDVSLRTAAPQEPQ